MVYGLEQDEVRHESWPLRLGPDAVRVGRRRAGGALHALRRLPVLHPRGRAAQRAAAHARDAARPRAAGLPARDDGPLQVVREVRRAGRQRPRCRRVRARARRPRLDMQAAPYDLRALGYEPVAIETPDGRAEYVRRQRELVDRAAPLRRPVGRGAAARPWLRSDARAARRRAPRQTDRVLHLRLTVPEDRSRDVVRLLAGDAAVTNLPSCTRVQPQAARRRHRVRRRARGGQLGDRVAARPRSRARRRRSSPTSRRSCSPTRLAAPRRPRPGSRVRRGRVGGRRGAHQRGGLAVDDVRRLPPVACMPRGGGRAARQPDPHRRRDGGRPGVRPDRRALRRDGGASAATSFAPLARRPGRRLPARHRPSPWASPG